MILARALISFIVVFVLQISAALLSYAFRILLARALPQTDYGLYFSIFSLFGLISIFITLGLGTSIAKKVAELYQRKAFSILKGSIIFAFFVELLIAIIAFVLIFLFSNFLAVNYFKVVISKYLLLIFGLTLFALPFLDLTININIGLQKPIFYSLFEFFRHVGIVIFSIFFLFLGLGVLAPTLAFTIAYFFVAIFSFFTITKFLKKIFKKRANFSLIKEIFSYGLQVIFYVFAGVVILNTDTLMLTYFKTLNEVALYNVAAPTARALWLFPISLTLVLFPISAKLWQRKNEVLSKGISLVYKWSLILIIPLALVAFSFPKIIINFFFGSAYLEASLVLKILAIAAIAYTFAAINSSIFIGIGKALTTNAIAWLAAIINFIANLFLIPKFSILGAAIASLFSFLIMCFLSIFLISKIIRIRLNLIDALKIVFCGFAFLALIALLKAILIINPILEFVLVSLLASFAYILLLFLVKSITIDEIAWVISSLLRRIF